MVSDGEDDSDDSSGSLSPVDRSDVLLGLIFSHLSSLLAGKVASTRLIIIPMLMC